MTEKTNVAIAGGGLSGLTTAFFLQKKNIPYILIEKEINFGGLCRSERFKDYIFDYTGHLLHFSRKDVRKFIEGLNLNLIKHERKAFILHSSRMIPYPFQANLAHLEPEEAYQALTSFLKRVKKKKCRTTEELFKSLFGDAICAYFFNPYNQKLWTTDLSMLAPDWIGRFVPKVEEDQVLRPFIFKDEKTGIGYNSEFFYPEGGIGVLPATLSEKLFSACSGEKIVKIFYKEKTIKTEKREISYEKLVYTLPLNLFASLAHPPLRGDMLTAFKKLKHVSVLDIEYALKGKNPDYHWVYLPQKNLLPYRVGCSSNFYGAPEGKYSVYAEISYGDSRMLPRMNEEEIAQKVLCQLKKAGLIDASSVTEKILTRKIDPAYVLFDFERKKVLRRIFSFFKEKSIFPLGRYGRWEYSSMEESMGDAMDMAVSFYGK